MTTWFPRVGAHSVSWLFVHVVWATRGRHPTIERALDRHLEPALASTASAIGAELHTYGAFDDHVHVLVQIPPELRVAALAHRLKGTSSHAFRRSGISWQAGYWAESVSRRALERCSVYVRDQRDRHAAGMHDEPWQRADPTMGWSPPSVSPEAPDARRQRDSADTQPTFEDTP